MQRFHGSTLAARAVGTVEDEARRVGPCALNARRRAPIVVTNRSNESAQRIGATNRSDESEQRIGAAFA
jgi:hypothetical protein